MSTLLKTENDTKTPNCLEGWFDGFFSIPHSNLLRKQEYRWSYRKVMVYKNNLELWRYYFRHKIDKLFLQTPQAAPISFLPFENAFTGWKIGYEPFDNKPCPRVDGFHDIDNEASVITVFYADNLHPVRMRFTVAHELMHVYQRLDPHFRSSMEMLPSDEMRVRLVERLANQSAAYYLMPEGLLRHEFAEHDRNIWPTELVLASLFKVSEQSIDIALKEYGIVGQRNRSLVSRFDAPF